MVLEFAPQVQKQSKINSLEVTVVLKKSQLVLPHEQGSDSIQQTEIALKIVPKGSDQLDLRQT